MRKALLVTVFLALFVGVAAADSHEPVEDFEVLDGFDEELAGGEVDEVIVNFTSAREHSQPIVMQLTVDAEEYEVSADAFDITGYMTVDGDDRSLSCTSSSTDGSLLTYCLEDDGWSVMEAGKEYEVSLFLEAHPALKPGAYDFELDFSTAVGVGPMYEDAEQDGRTVYFPEKEGYDAALMFDDESIGEFEVRDVVAVNAPAPGERVFVDGIEFHPRKGDTVEQVRVRYDDTDVEDVREQTLHLYWFDPYAHEWRNIGSEVAAGENTVTADIEENGLYAVFGEPLPPETDTGAGDAPETRPRMRATELERTPDHVKYRLEHIRQDRFQLDIGARATNVELVDAAVTPAAQTTHVEFGATVGDMDETAAGSAPADVASLGFVDIDYEEFPIAHGIEDATLTLAVDRPDSVVPDAVQVYRVTDAGWEPVPTEHVSGDRFVTELDRFSTFAVAYPAEADAADDRPATADITVTETSVGDVVDGTVSVTVTARNDGDADGERMVAVAVGERTVERTIAVPAGATVTETFDVDVSGMQGRQQVTVDEEPVDAVTVQAQPDTGLTATPVGRVVAQPVSFVVTVLLLLLGVVAYGVYRRRDGRLDL